MTQHKAGLADLFVGTLKDVYSAEKQVLRALPKMARAAQSDELREAFETHRDQTEDQVERLELVFEMIRTSTRGPSCEAMEGLLEEGAEIMEAYRGSEALDAGLIGSAQSIEHYEIGRYDSLMNWARELDLEEAANLLEESLREEKETDRILAAIAMSGMAPSAKAGSTARATLSAKSPVPKGAAQAETKRGAGKTGTSSGMQGRGSAGGDEGTSTARKPG